MSESLAIAMSGIPSVGMDVLNVMGDCGCVLAGTAGDSSTESVTRKIMTTVEQCLAELAYMTGARRTG